MSVISQDQNNPNNLPPPMSFEEIEQRWFKFMNQITQTPMTPHMALDKQMEIMQGAITEMLRTLKAHHPGKPLLIASH